MLKNEPLLVRWGERRVRRHSLSPQAKTCGCGQIIGVPWWFSALLNQPDFSQRVKYGSRVLFRFLKQRSSFAQRQPAFSLESV